MINQNLEIRKEVIKSTFENAIEEANFFADLYTSISLSEYDISEMHKNNQTIPQLIAIKTDEFWQSRDYLLQIQTSISDFFSLSDFWQSTKFVCRVLQ